MRDWNSIDRTMQGLWMDTALSYIDLQRSVKRMVIAQRVLGLVVAVYIGLTIGSLFNGDLVFSLIMLVGTLFFAWSYHKGSKNIEAMKVIVVDYENLRDEHDMPSYDFILQKYNEEAEERSV